MIPNVGDLLVLGARTVLWPSARFSDARDSTWRFAREGDSSILVDVTPAGVACVLSSSGVPFWTSIENLVATMRPSR